MDIEVKKAARCQVVLGHHFCTQWLEVSWVTVCWRVCERFVVVCMTVKLCQALEWRECGKRGYVSPQGVEWTRRVSPVGQQDKKTHHSRCLQRGWPSCLSHKQPQDPTMAAKQTWNSQTSKLGYKHFLQVHWCARSSWSSERKFH